ncbi:LysR family transcriptional regulator [Collinsella tanakaei]|uniref:LysR family transcriptional regulator n=1 Tax=Collinsella tanakaei TaxID=626935 RepID=UPI001F3F8F7D|nr:LysR family transcriptional regulator [Collinsella tanakaei]MCF2622383.1 LysR family transcriptional regulator [Collinsella tanakaei]
MLDYRARTFLEVYRLRSYTHAATALHITQPAVSQHIRQLEQHYGCVLFAKAGRGIEPTEAGELLYRALDVMENDDARLRTELDALAAADTARPPLRFGCTRTVADYVAPRLLAGHLARHPEERILMRTGNTTELVALIDQGDIDFALVEGSFDRKAFDSAVFSREPYIAVAGEALAPTRLEDLLDQRLILREPGSGTREILERYLAVRNLSVDDFAGVIEVASIPAIKACVRAGAGISFLYRVAVEEELARGELFDITPDDVSIEHDFALIWQRGSRYAESYRALLRVWKA